MAKVNGFCIYKTQNLSKNTLSTQSYLVDALHEVIQQAWTSETLPRSWTEGVLCLVYICLLNVTYKVFAKILYDRLLPHTNAVVQHYQAGFQSDKSTTDQLFARAKS
jgi:hypothetical protein